MKLDLSQAKLAICTVMSAGGTVQQKPSPVSRNCNQMLKFPYLPRKKMATTEWDSLHVTAGIKKLDLTSPNRQWKEMSAFKERLSGLSYILF